MAISWTEINDSDEISSAPAVLNGNFTVFEEHINAIEELLNPTNKVINLTNKTTLPNGGIEGSAVVATATSGNLFVGSPNGGALVFYVTYEGDITGRKTVLSGTGDNKSTIAEAVINTLSVGSLTLTGVVDLTGASTVVKQKYGSVQLTDSNIGAAASSPVDISKGNNLFFNYYNGGVALTGVADVKLDLANMVEGQVVRIHCLGSNASGMRIFNGTTNNEIFARINPSTGGFQSIAAASKPTFSVSTAPNDQAWLVCQWVNIGGGTFRLLILDSKNISNI